MSTVTAHCDPYALTTRPSSVRRPLQLRLWLSRRLSPHERDERGGVSVEVVIVMALLCLVSTGGIVAVSLTTDNPWAVVVVPAGLLVLVVTGAAAMCMGVVAAERRADIRARDERGIASAWVVLMATALLAVAGLVIDGGYALGAKREAMNQAEQAARAGADALDEGSLRSGESSARVNPGRAIAAAQTYLSQVGAQGTVSVDGDEVSVTVTASQDTTILSAVGVGSLPVKATATALSINEDDG